MKQKRRKHKVRRGTKITALALAALMLLSTFATLDNMRVLAEETGIQTEVQTEPGTDSQLQVLSENRTGSGGETETEVKEEPATESKSNSQVNTQTEEATEVTDETKTETEMEVKDATHADDGTDQTVAPDQVPVDVLRQSLADEQASRATDADSVDIYQYAAENELFDINDGQPIEFAGGMITRDTAPIYDDEGGQNASRIFSYAGFVYQYEGGAGGNVPIRISGLFPYNNEWYYTLTDEVADNNGIMVGYKLTGSWQVRFYYELTDNTYYNITTKIASGEENYWNVSVDAEQQNPNRARWGTQVTVEVDLPSRYSYGYVRVNGGGIEYTVALTRNTESNNGETPNDGTFNEELVSDSVENSHYTVNFTMPKGATTVTFTGTEWLTNRTFYYGVAINEGNAAQPAMYGITRIYTKSVGGRNTDAIVLNDNSNEASIGEHHERTWSGLQDDTRSAWGVSLSGYRPTTAESGYPMYTPYDAYGMDTAGGGAYHSIENYYNGQNYLEWLSSTGTYRETIFRSNYANTTKLARIFPDVIYGASYNNPGGLSEIKLNDKGQYQGKIATGHFKPNDKVELRVETNRGQFTSASGNPYLWRYIPASIYVDVYRGRNQFQTDNYERMQINLPVTSDSLNKSYTYEHPMGGRITITPIAINNTNYIVQGNRNMSRAYSRTDNGGRYRETGVYAYDITIENMNNAFKVIYNGYQSSQRRFVLGTTSGIELPSTVSSGTGVSDVNGSYMRISSSGRYQSLAIGTNWFGENRNVTFGIKPQEGYTVPKATLTKETSEDNATITETPTTMTPDNQGRYTYTLSEGSGPTSDIGNSPVRVNFESKPIDFPVTYYDTDGSMVLLNTESILSYGGQRNYTVRYIEPEIIDDGEYFSGYQLQVRTAGGEVLATLAQDTVTDGLVDANPSDLTQLWQQNEIIDVTDIYEYLSRTGKLDQSRESYTIALVAVTDTDNRSLANISYSIRTQPGWLSDKQASYNSGSTNYDNAAFDTVSGTFSGYVGSKVILAGYQTEKTEGTEHYILDTYGSKLGGTVQEPSSNGAQEIGYLYYLKSVKAQIYVPQELKDLSAFNNAETLINKWNEENSNKNYTSISGRDDRLVYANGNGGGTALSMPATITIDDVERKFAGWKVVNTSAGDYEGLTTEQLNLYQYTSSLGNLSGNNYTPATIDLYTLGTESVAGGQEVWSAVFGDSTTTGTGQLILVPYYESSYGEIGNNYDDITNTVTTHTGGDPDSDGDEGNGFDIEASFSYLESNGTWEGHRNALTIALYRSTGNGNTQNQLWGTITYSNGRWNLTPTNSSGGKLSTEVSVTDNGWSEDNQTNIFTVQVRILNRTQNGNESIQYNWEDKDNTQNGGAIYHMYAWTPANDPSNEITASDGNPPAEAAQHTTKVDVLPKAVTSCRKESDVVDGNLNGDEYAEGIYHQRKWNTTVEADGDGNVTVTAQFDGDRFYPTELQTGSSAPEKSKLHTALFRKTNNSDDEGWYLVEADGKINSSADSYVTGPEISIVNEPVNGQAATHIKVTYKIDKDHMNSHGSDLDFCIAVWNNTNTNGQTVTADDTTNGFKPDDDMSRPENSYYYYIPSVTSHLIFGWEDPGQYVTIPRQVLLTEDKANVAGAGEGEYAGAPVKITLRVTELPDGSDDTLLIERIRVHIPQEIGLMYNPGQSHQKQLIAKGYSEDGELLTIASDNHTEVGIFDASQLSTGTAELSMTFYLNALLTETNTVNGEQYLGNMTFMFTNVTDENNPGDETGNS